MIRSQCIIKFLSESASFILQNFTRTAHMGREPQSVKMKVARKNSTNKIKKVNNNKIKEFSKI